MKSVVGIFQSLSVAEHAIEKLGSMVGRKHISLLTPNSTAKDIADIPTVAMEGPGIGKALGGLVGGALGAAGGIHLGMTAASTMVPGVGPVVATGVAAAALFGTGAALGGAALGGLVENSLDEGLPKDELFVYEDALRKGRTIVILQTRDEGQADASRRVMAEAGAEDLDSARQDWWAGLRDAEEQCYTPGWGDFKTDELCYRMGFESAQRVGLRGKSYSSALNLLQKRYPIAVCSHGAFRRGFERGQVYCENQRKQHQASA
jgi:hypothetical protein